MKRIILSEGKNDVHLVSSFCGECDRTLEVKKFYGEDIESSFRSKESRAIRRFQERRNPYHILAKSENGKSNLKKAFAGLVNQLMDIDPAVFVLADLDGGRLDRLVADFDEQIQDRHNGRIELGPPSNRNRNGDMVGATCEVVTAGGKTKGEFHFVAFKQTLERAAGTSHEEDRETQERKIEALLNEDHVFDLLDSMLNGRVA